MKPARLIIAGVAGVAGLIALLLSGRQPAPITVTVPEPAPEVKRAEVLVAKRDLPMGTALGDEELAWMPWPAELAQNAMIQRAARPNALEEFKGAITRQSFYANEPIREEKVIKGSGSGFLSAILPSGKRAIAISIDSRGATSAGGFILPNDFVDVITTRRDPEASQRAGVDVFQSSTVLTNVRVLAIGQNIQEKNGERVVVGETATLELDPAQAELVTLYQRTGSLALALRSMADANKPDESRARSPAHTVTVVRFGIAQEVPNR
ncbi:Flp pilus assembly protein CpaB [Rhabdaerophilum calidifontis]|uniref:Flp pilus assembly protein CpaB n=1 Tax=Rhabdaerophilum calidifontis TaxID=2604328 RepID=UPI00123B5621|nr:Flp pilus assembly protein CpaB [Rhabdaerophilum calidifontis]